MERIIDLNGPWELYYFEEIGQLPQNPEELQNFVCDKILAQVPGNVELDLARAKKIDADPFYGLNSQKLRRYEGYQWWYLRNFCTPEWMQESKTALIFEGIDCFATIWINGIKVGTCSNALIRQTFDVSPFLKSTGGKNHLAIRLSSPINSVKDLPIDAHALAWPSRYESLWARKPAHAYGWDIMPRILSAGLWRPVYLKEIKCTEITECFVDTRAIQGNIATLECHISFRTDLPLRDWSLRLAGSCNDSVFEKEFPLFFNHGVFDIEIKNPKLWWPKGYGKASLYEMSLSLSYQGQILAEKKFKLGIRTLALDHSDLNTREKPGRFSFIVNDTPIFCRGTNWVPADAFHSRDAERIPRILDLIRDMGCNMVRCWGGNVYETHDFFDFCDREGIMVWQDFGMACAVHPQHPEFLNIIQKESEWVVKELRQHASIALWSGDNEVDEMNCCWQSNRRYDPNQNKLTREVLPETVRLHDPRRPYLPSSPYLAPASMTYPEPNRVVPEQHLWGPRNYYKSDFYTNHTALFASEIGYHGCPNVSSIRRFISPEKLWPCQENDEWNHHSTDSVPEYPLFHYRVPLMLTQIRELFGTIPDGLEHFAVASQIVQAEAKKFFFELFRQKKGITTGILWWNMMDGWPQMSDAIVDYYFHKKLAYWYLRRAHRPLSIVIHEPNNTLGGKLEVSAVNDSLTPRNGQFRIWDADSGEVLIENSFTVSENARQSCGFIEAPKTNQHLFLFTWEAGEEKGCGHYLYGKPPFDYLKYRNVWLPQIASLDGTFSEHIAE